MLFHNRGRFSDNVHGDPPTLENTQTEYGCVFMAQLDRTRFFFLIKPSSGLDRVPAICVYGPSLVRLCGFLFPPPQILYVTVLLSDIWLHLPPPRPPPPKKKEKKNWNLVFLLVSIFFNSIHSNFSFLLIFTQVAKIDRMHDMLVLPYILK